jgi:hypothetical protein
MLQNKTVQEMTLLVFGVAVGILYAAKQMLM